ncbi:MAG: hypothetical protein R3C46_03495 [Hyphomonadaceae bacterium]
MKWLAGVIVSGLFALAALPASAQSSGANTLETGGLICFNNNQMAHESPAEYQQRIRNQRALPGWIFDAIDKMQNAPDAMTFTFRQVGGDRVLVANGGVDNNAAAHLEAALRQYGPIHEVWFNSPGGSSYQGVLMGEMIRAHGAGTRVLRGDGCASACSTAFLGGVMRRVEPGAVYGIHIYSRPLDTYGPADQDEQNAMVQREVREATQRSFYVGKMGIGKLWLDLWSNTNPGCMTFMSQREMRDSFVNNID